MSTAHLCAYFETDESGAPQFKGWGIYSSGPGGLTTHVRGGFYMELLQSGADSYDKARREIRSYIEQRASNARDKQWKLIEEQTR